MAVKRYVGDRFVGVDSDKGSSLSKAADGSIYIATDDLKIYLKEAGSWSELSSASSSTVVVENTATASGYLSYYTGEQGVDALEFDGETGVYYDTENRRLGINHHSPQYPLDLSGNFNFVGEVYQSGSRFGIQAQSFGITGDGSTTGYALPFQVDNSKLAVISVDGLVNDPDGDYFIDPTLTGLRFIEAPKNNSQIEVRNFYLGTS